VTRRQRADAYRREALILERGRHRVEGHGNASDEAAGGEKQHDETSWRVNDETSWRVKFGRPSVGASGGRPKEKTVGSRRILGGE
jgi:hypothetical protein